MALPAGPRSAESRPAESYRRFPVLMVAAHLDRALAVTVA
jgi:hypothetical protein